MSQSPLQSVEDFFGLHITAPLAAKLQLTIMREHKVSWYELLHMIKAKVYRPCLVLYYHLKRKDKKLSQKTFYKTPTKMAAVTSPENWEFEGCETFRNIKKRQCTEWSGSLWQLRVAKMSELVSVT
jgi:hypothetical protein